MGEARENREQTQQQDFVQRIKHLAAQLDSSGLIKTAGGGAVPGSGRAFDRFRTALCPGSAGRR